MPGPVFQTMKQDNLICENFIEYQYTAIPLKQHWVIPNPFCDDEVSDKVI
jgi:hypothetical protein